MYIQTAQQRAKLAADTLITARTNTRLSVACFIFYFALIVRQKQKQHRKSQALEMLHQAEKLLLEQGSATMDRTSCTCILRLVIECRNGKAHAVRVRVSQSFLMLQP